jgi:hypothetical protein
MYVTKGQTRNNGGQKRERHLYLIRVLQHTHTQKNTMSTTLNMVEIRAQKRISCVIHIGHGRYAAPSYMNGVLWQCETNTCYCSAYWDRPQQCLGPQFVYLPKLN